MHSEIGRSQVRTQCNCNCNARLRTRTENTFQPILPHSHTYPCRCLAMKIQLDEDAVSPSIPQLRTRTEYTYLPVIPHAHAQLICLCLNLQCTAGLMKWSVRCFLRAFHTCTYTMLSWALHCRQCTILQTATLHALVELFISLNQTGKG